MVLSRRSDMEQMAENIRTFEEDKPLNEQEMETLLGIASEMVRRLLSPARPAGIV